jgi:hypothetical protein
MMNAQKKGWTPERRAKQSEAIRKWKPWARSTGPKTAPGKARSAANANVRWAPTTPDRMVRYALRRHSRFLQNLNDYLRFSKKFPSCELLKPWAATLYRQGEDAGNHLCIALVADDIMQKSCNLGPPEANS